MSERPEPQDHTLFFLDLETTGLHPRRHELWEIGLIEERVSADGKRELVRFEETYHVRPLELAHAEPKALEIGGYYRRGRDVARWLNPTKLASELAPRFEGAYLVGCAIHFDAEFLANFLERNDHVPMWNHHLIDATVYAAGVLGLRPPYKSRTVREMLGVKMDEANLHSAVHDAAMARDIYWAAHDLAATRQS